jgi:HupE/UreJ protein
VVLTDSAGETSTPGIVDADHETLEIVDGGQATPIGDMLRYGFHHVLEGVDHLLFLLALLLPAPLVAAAGRWRRGTGPVSTAKAVLRVVSAFTLGHSITLIAAALGWITVPSRPVEVLIAASVGVAAVHAIRPLAARGEAILAMGFGLVHGLAFAGILSDLGIVGTTSLLSLLAFNVGIELAQLTCVALVFPSLYVLSRTRFYPAFRVAGASLALAAATGWGLERLGALDNPLGAVEATAVAHLSSIVALLAALAIVARLLDGRPGVLRARTASE